MVRWYFKTLFLIFLAVIILNSANAIAIGVSPGVFTFKNVLRGGYVEANVLVQNPNGFPITIGSWTTGDIEGWTTIDPAVGDIVLPAGFSGEFKVMVRPPAFVQNGVYQGYVTFLTGYAPSETGGGSGSSVQVGSGISFIIEVIDQEIKNATVSNIIIEKTEECSPIKFDVTTVNTGNVEVTPTYSVTLLSADKTTEIKTIDFNIKSVLPSVQRTDVLEFPYEIAQFRCVPVGSYVATIKGSYDNTQFFSAEIPFQIYGKGTISLTGELEGLIHNHVGYMGEPMKIVGKFKNNGDTSERAKLKVEVYKDNRLVSVLESDEKIATYGKTTDLEVFYTPTEVGEFKLYGTVDFGGITFGPAQSTLTVELGLTTLLLLAMVPIIIIVIIVAVIFYKKRQAF
jgi:hypothetical protein